jgi:hypothetical protein
VLFNGTDITPPGGELEWDAFPEERKQKLLKGYANSLTVLCCVSWLMCQMGYYRMYCVYPQESISLHPHQPVPQHDPASAAEDEEDLI